MKIHYTDIKYRIKSWRKTSQLLEKVIREYGYKPGDLNFIITNDSFITELNKKYLGHNYPTDVISFRYNEGKIIDGDIFISIDAVKNNAINYNVSQENEMRRVLIHGTLHLCGYEDGSNKQRDEIRKLEDYWLEKWESLDYGFLF